MTKQTTLRLGTQILLSVKWARYAAILSFMNLGLGLLQMLVGWTSGGAVRIGTLFTFLASAGITLVMSINLYQYVKYSRQAKLTHDAGLMGRALYHLRIYFTVMGILFVIITTLVMLFLLLGLLVKILDYARA
ncbi:MAG: hypothetical protein RIQ62_1199 [Bacteroidota bacterium]|jgi:hypothetical protein